jgi:hypothetical protein
VTGDWRALAACAALGLMLTALFAYLAVQGEAHGLPDRARLKELQGTLSHVAKNKYDVEFRLEPWKTTFQYPTKARALATVAAELHEGHAATVFVDGSTFADGEEERATIFALTVNGKVIRSFAQVEQAWRAENSVFSWLTGVFGVATLALAATAVYERRNRTA